MIPLWAIGLLKNKWTWIMVAAGAMFLFSFYKIVEYGNERYKAGQMAERVVWQTVVQEAADEANRLRRQRDAALAASDAESARLTAERNTALAQVQEQIRNATNVEDQFAAYRAHHDSVRTQSTRNLNLARERYLSSLGSQPTERAPDTGSSDPGPDVTGSLGLRDVEGLMVGYGLGQR